MKNIDGFSFCMIANMLIFLLLLMPSVGNAQDELMELLETEAKHDQHFAEATFKGSRLINGHTIETRQKSALEFLISHRFGRLNSGAYEFFGLDAANIRLGLDYAVSDRLTLGFGRNSLEKVYDGFVKFRLIRQQSGKRNSPISATWFSNLAITTLKSDDPSLYPSFAARIAYTHQLLLASKISSGISLQFMPTLIHRNRIEDTRENDLFATGIGGRVKLTKRLSLNGEYYYRWQTNNEGNRYNSVALGFDLETGGHVFQLHVTNSRAMNEKAFITETDGDISNGDIHFGFNVSRTF